MANIPDDRANVGSQKSDRPSTDRPETSSSKPRFEKEARKPKPEDDLVADATNEIKAMTREGLEHPSTKPVMKGAAVGAIVGGILPVVTWPVGLAVGAGYMLYKRLRP